MKHTITGNRELTILSVYELETKEERINFFERFDFGIIDVINLLHFYCLHYEIEEIDMEDSYLTVIETDNYIFRFRNGDFISLHKKYNVLDELREKYNLPF